MTDELHEAVARAIAEAVALNHPINVAHHGRYVVLLDDLSPAAMEARIQEFMRDNRENLLLSADAAIPLIRAAVLEEAAHYCDFKANIRRADTLGTLADISGHFRQLAVQARERSPRALDCSPAPGATPRAEPREEDRR